MRSCAVLLWWAVLCATHDSVARRGCAAAEQKGGACSECLDIFTRQTLEREAPVYTKGSTATNSALCSAADESYGCRQFPNQRSLSRQFPNQRSLSQEDKSELPSYQTGTPFELTSETKTQDGEGEATVGQGGLPRVPLELATSYSSKSHRSPISPKESVSNKRKQVAAPLSLGGADGPQKIRTCIFVCLINVACTKESPRCNDRVFISGSFWCRFFSECPSFDPAFTIFYIPYKPADAPVGPDEAGLAPSPIGAKDDMGQLIAAGAAGADSVSTAKASAAATQFIPEPTGPPEPPSQAFVAPFPGPTKSTAPGFAPAPFVFPSPEHVDVDTQNGTKLDEVEERVGRADSPVKAAQAPSPQIAAKGDLQPPASEAAPAGPGAPVPAPVPQFGATTKLAPMAAETTLAPAPVSEVPAPSTKVGVTVDIPDPPPGATNQCYYVCTDNLCDASTCTAAEPGVCTFWAMCPPGVAPLQRVVLPSEDQSDPPGTPILMAPAPAPVPAPAPR